MCKHTKRKDSPPVVLTLMHVLPSPRFTRAFRVLMLASYVWTELWCEQSIGHLPSTPVNCLLSFPRLALTPLDVLSAPEKREFPWSESSDSFWAWRPSCWCWWAWSCQSTPWRYTVSRSLCTRLKFIFIVYRWDSFGTDRRKNSVYNNNWIRLRASAENTYLDLDYSASRLVNNLIC